MFGEPSDEESECNARLFIADNYGDNSASIRCQLTPGHDGLHREQFERKGGTVTITWVADERERCDHGCGQWDHAHGSRYDDDAIPCPKDADDHEYSDCAYCHPADPAQTCGKCVKTYYYAEGHKRHCPKEPYTCTVCGESGVGPHVWEKKRKIVEASPCLVDSHCSGECPMPYVAVRKSVTISHRGYPTKITELLTVDPTWNTTLAEFCKELGIKTKGKKAAWWLVSDWN